MILTINANQMLAFEERGKPENTEENLSVLNREPTNSTHKMAPNLVIELTLVGSECSHYFQHQ